MPRHVEKSDAADVIQMIEAAHSAGFDAISASVILTGKDGTDNRKHIELSAIYAESRVDPWS